MRRKALDKFYASAGALEAYLSVPPGITGPWQVSGRSEVGYRDCVALDLTYVREVSMHRDLLILLRTVVVVHRRGAR